MPFLTWDNELRVRARGVVDHSPSCCGCVCHGYRLKTFRALTTQLETAGWNNWKEGDLKMY